MAAPAKDLCNQTDMFIRSLLEIFLQAQFMPLNEASGRFNLQLNFDVGTFVAVDPLLILPKDHHFYATPLLMIICSTLHLFQYPFFTYYFHIYCTLWHRTAAAAGCLYLDFPRFAAFNGAIFFEYSKIES